MFDRLDRLEEEFLAVEARLGDPQVLGDLARLRDESRRYKELTPIVEAYHRYRERRADRDAAEEMFADATGDDRESMRAEMVAADVDLGRLTEALKLLLLPRDPDAGKPVIVEIRGAEGGEEANLFARDLFAMYQGYATRQGWGFEVLSSDPSERGGVNEVTVRVVGDEAWTRLKFEGGPHRVQRVPVTESQGRIHTSSATVLVLPEAAEVDVHLDPNDLQIDVYRSSGPGGQSVNTTDSAVRITHRPSGLVVAMQDERSQLQNRTRALQVLRTRLLHLEQERHQADLAVERRAQVGGGGRSEKIRTYNYKENRVTDHRLGLTLYRLQDVLGGDLDELVSALLAEERARQLTGAVAGEAG